jgi:hypothetical protein
MGMTNKIKSILAVIVLVAAFVLGAVLGWHIKPGARPEATEPAKMTINPTTKEVKKADVAVKAISQGRLSGTVKLPIATTVVTVKDKPPDPVQTESVGQTIPAPVEVTVPVSGTIMARYTDAKTGAQIGKDTRALTGETVVKVEGDRLQVDTKFDDTVTFAVDLPEREPVKWHVGAYYDGGWTGYLQRDWRLFKSHWLIWARGEVEMVGDADRRAVVGVERRW